MIPPPPLAYDAAVPIARPIARDVAQDAVQQPGLRIAQVPAADLRTGGRRRQHGAVDDRHGQRGAGGVVVDGDLADAELVAGLAVEPLGLEEGAARLRLLLQPGVETVLVDEVDEDEALLVSGERNLLSVSDFSSDMGNLRRAFDLFEQKAQLVRLLDISAQAEGVRIYIGGESQIVPMEELSVVSAPYEVDGHVVGTLGVIGPTRMAYDRMIQIVDITSKLVSNALSHK